MFDNEDDIEEDDFDETLHRFEQMVEQNSSSFFEEDEFVSLVEHYIGKRNTNMAKSALDLALTIYPNSFDIQLRRVEYLLYIGSFTEATDLLDKLDCLSPKTSEVYFIRGQIFHLRGYFDIACKEFEESLRICTSSVFDLLTEIAKFLTSNYSFASAIPYLQRAHEIVPNDLKVIFDLAYCYDFTECLDEAIEYLNKYLDIDPFSETVWSLLGNIYKTVGRNDEAVEAFDYALAICPDLKQVLDQKSEILIGQGKFEEVVEQYKELIKEYPNDVSFYVSLALVYEDSGKEDIALEYYQKALLINPNDASLCNALGFFYIETHKPQDSIFYLEQATKLEASNYDFWIDLGRGYSEVGNEDAAFEAFNTAISLDNSQSDGYVQAAGSFVNQGKYSKALEFIERAEEVLDVCVPLSLLKAVALFFLHRSSEAVEVLAEAKAIDENVIDSFAQIMKASVNESNLNRFIDRIP